MSKWSAFLLLSALLAGIGLLSLAAATTDDALHLSPTIGLICLVAGIFIWAFAFYVLVFHLLKAFIRVAAAMIPFTGSTPQSQIISASLTALVFYGPLTTVVRVIVKVTSTTVIFVPQMVSRLLKTPAEQIFRDADSFVTILQTMIAECESFLNDFLAALVMIPIAWSVVAAGVWVLFGQLLRAHPFGLFNWSTVFRNTPQFCSGIPTSVRTNVLHLSVALVGFYLSMAAIVAIPYLQGLNDPRAITSEQAAQRLNALYTQEQFDKSYPQSLGNTGNSLVAALRESLDGIVIPDDASREPFKARWAQVEVWKARTLSAIKQGQDLDALVQTKWSETRVNGWRGIQGTIKSATSSFETYVNSGSGKTSRAKYFRRLLDWAEYGIGDVEARLQYTRSNLETMARFVDAQLDYAAEPVKQLSLD